MDDYSTSDPSPFIESLEPRILLDATATQGALAFASYLGGSGNDQATAIVVDSQDNIIIVGYTYSDNSSTEDPWIANGHRTTRYGDADAFVVKLSPSGELIWSTYLGGVFDDRAYDVAVDSNDRIAVTGYSQSPDWVSGGYDTDYANNKDGFVALFETDGTLGWSTYLGSDIGGDGDHIDIGYGVAFDHNDNLFVTGYTQSAGWAFDIYGTPYTQHGENDGFIVKLDNLGNHIWSAYIGESSFDFAQSVTVDSAGNPIVVGSTQSDGWTAGGYDLTRGGQNDAFVVKYSADGVEQWSTYLGDAGNDIGYSIAVDGADDILVVGYTQSDGWTSNDFEGRTVLQGDRDGFIVKLAEDGQHQWSMHLGGNLDDEVHDITFDNQGNLLISGRTYSSGWTSLGYDVSHAGQRDGFLLKYDADGNHLWSTFFGGNDDEHAPGVAVNSQDNITIAGYTYSNNIHKDGFDDSYNGGADAYVAQIIIKTVGGKLYADLNNNGQQDAGEYALENWTVLLNDGERSFTTDSQGKFYISDLDASTHKITLDENTNDPGGVWTITDPAAQFYFVKINDDQAILDLDFGSNPQFCEFRGTVFIDDNDDGEYEADNDTLKEGWRVFLDLDNDQVWDEEDGELSTLTDENGYYEFLEILPGEYHITVETPDGWQQTSPIGDPDTTLNNPYVITVEAGDTSNTELDFGLFFYYGVIEGNVFLDLNDNAVKDIDEEGLLGWRVFADLNFNQKWDAEEPYDLPDINGDYIIENLEPGLYLITAETNGFWKQTTNTTTIFAQDFETALTDIEYLSGQFVRHDSHITEPNLDNDTYMVGHADDYNNDEYSYYEFKLNLTGYSEVTLEFEYIAQMENFFDRFNVQISKGSINPPDDLIEPVSGMIYEDQPGVGTRAELGERGFDGDGNLTNGHAVFDLGDFAGDTVTIRLQFGSDSDTISHGINLDNILVTGVPIDRPANPPVTTAVIRGETTSNINFGQIKLDDADYNGDGIVSLLDLDTLGVNYALTDGSADKTMGDANGDGNVTLLDLDVLGLCYNLQGSQTAPSIDDVPDPEEEDGGQAASMTLPGTNVFANILHTFHQIDIDNSDDEQSSGPVTLF